MGFNFEINEQLIKETEITLPDLNSELWETHRGAYGSIWNEIDVLARVISGEETEQEEFEDAFENLCETLWHQMSFYSASYLGVPYMLRLLEQKILEQDFEWQLRLFSEIGMIVTCDIERNHYGKNVEPSLKENYNRCIRLLAEYEKQFIMKYSDKLKELDWNEKSYFYTTALAVFGDREAAFVLMSLMFNEVYVVCTGCDEYNEHMPAISSGEIREIKPAEAVIGRWDKKSLDDIYVWYSNFVHMLGDDTAAGALSYYYGTYTCPECGKKSCVMELAKKYFEM